jgi:protease-4
MSDTARKPRRWPWILLALAGVLSAPALIGVGVAIGLSDKAAEVESGTMLELKIAGGFSEGPNPTADIFAELSPGKLSSIWELRNALRRAADDDAISGLLIEIESVAMGYAAMGELVDELERFKASGKPLHVLVRTDTVGEGAAFIAAAGSKVWATPEAMWMVNGLHADVEFYKGSLDKIHVEPDFIMFKEYKSAGEPYSREEMSEYFREALTDVVGDIQGNYVDELVAMRGMDRGAFMRLFNAGGFTPAQALEVGLVDELGYLDQVREAMLAEAGIEEWEGMSLGKYLKHSAAPEVPEGAHRVALIFGEGPIVATGGDASIFGGGAQIAGPKVAASIREAAEDEDVEAIVFRVNSPGGSAVGSDLIWREIERAQEAGKPVVVSMSTVAGSGGYWVSMGADAIVARPDTITGSIGVVFGKFNVRGLYEWAGAHVDSVSFAENAGIMSPFSTMSESQRALMTDLIGAMYDDFTAKVAEGRGLPVERVRELAKGRIWSGVDALENGLVDRLRSPRRRPAGATRRPTWWSTPRRRICSSSCWRGTWSSRWRPAPITSPGCLSTSRRPLMSWGLRERAS